MTRMQLLVGGLTEESLTGFPNLTRLCARSRAHDIPAEAGLSAALARLFGIGVDNLAAIALADEGTEPGTGSWFRADPVHLLAGMHSLTLFDSRSFRLDADESAVLVGALNRHFDGEIEFLAPHPTRWYARFKRTLTVASPPLDQIAGGMIAHDQIAGPDARELHRVVMEIQMLLYAHPVNEAREARNEPIVNSLWFWSGGQYRKPVPQFDQVMANDFHSRALAGAAGIKAIPLPERLDRLPDGHTLAVLEQPAAGHHDEAWFAPILRGLQRGHLDEVELTLTGNPARRCAIGRWRSLRFWINR